MKQRIIARLQTLQVDMQKSIEGFQGSDADDLEAVVIPGIEISWARLQGYLWALNDYESRSEEDG